MEVLCRPIGELETNCIILKCPEGAIMIDPGDDTDSLINFIDETGVKPGIIILTHGHFDHILGVAAMKRHLNARVLIGEKDAPMLSDRVAAMARPEYCRTPFEPVTADGFLEEGRITLCGTSFEVMSVPGHTPGGIALYSENDKVLISGDTLFYRGYGRTDFPGGSIKQLVESLRRLLSLPDDVMVYSGHGRSGLMGEIKKGYR